MFSKQKEMEYHFDNDHLVLNYVMVSQRSDHQNILGIQWIFVLVSAVFWAVDQLILLDNVRHVNYFAAHKSHI